MTMLDGPTLMGVAEVITSLTNLAVMVIAACKRGEMGGDSQPAPRRFPTRRSRLVARERHARPLR
jgi:hypothetical protein